MSDTEATAERAAYIASILTDWPAPTPRQERTICSLLGNGAGGATGDKFPHWEIEKYILGDKYAETNAETAEEDEWDV